MATQFEKPSVVFVGELDGVARILAPTLLALGARQFVFVSRHKAVTPGAETARGELEAQGLDVRVSLYSPSALQAILRQSRIQGIVYDGGIVKDSSIGTIARLIDEIRHVDAISTTCEITFFIAFSPATSLGVSPAECLIRQRAARSLPGVEIVLAHDSPAWDDAVLIQLFRTALVEQTQTGETCVITLAKTEDSIPAPPGQKSAVHATSSSVSNYPAPLSPLLKDDVPLETANATGPGLQKALSTCMNFRQAVSVVQEAVINEMASLLEQDSSVLCGEKRLLSLGIDSLISASFCNWVSVELRAQLATFELMQEDSIDSLALVLTRRSELTRHLNPEGI